MGETGSRKKLFLSYVPIAVLIIITLFRLIQSYRSNLQIDFLAYLDISRAIIKNLNPYDLKNLIYFPWQRLQVCYPSIAIFFIPFILMGKNRGRNSFFYFELRRRFRTLLSFV